MLEDDFNWGPTGLLVRSMVVLRHTADMSHDHITGVGPGVILVGRYIFLGSVKAIRDWFILICEPCGKSKGSPGSVLKSVNIHTTNGEAWVIAFI